MSLNITIEKKRCWSFENTGAINRSSAAKLLAKPSTSEQLVVLHARFKLVVKEKEDLGSITAHSNRSSSPWAVGKNLEPDGLKFFTHG